MRLKQISLTATTTVVSSPLQGSESEMLSFLFSQESTSTVLTKLSGLGEWNVFNFILFQLWILLSRDWQLPAFIPLMWTILLNRLWKEPRSLNRRARVRHWQKKGEGSRRMNQLRDPLEPLPHHGIISTNPTGTLSGQEVSCFQILGKSLWSKQLNTIVVKYIIIFKLFALYSYIYLLVKYRYWCRPLFPRAAWWQGQYPALKEWLIHKQGLIFSAVVGEC